MDLINVLQPFFDFFLEFCAVEITLGGFSFTVGALFIWCILVGIVINFMKGLSR